MALTRLQIITEGLSRAGRSDLTSDARLWLNLFLQKVYWTQDFKWLEKKVTDLSLTQNYTIFSDYRAMTSASVGANRVAMKQVDTLDEWMALTSSEAEDGVPTHFYVNQIDGVIEFFPAPTQGLTWNATYYHIPTIPTHTSDAGDGASPLWKLPEEIMIEAIKMYALDYNDDERFEKQEQRLFAKIAEARLNAQDSRASHGRFKLGKSFKKRF
jgi:hypothetical protein